MNSPTSGPQDPDQLVRRFIEHLIAKDLDAACSLVSDDCEYDNVPIGKVTGPEGIRSVLQGFLGNCDVVEWIILRQVSSGDMSVATVVNERNDRAKMNGRYFDLPVAGFFEIRNGRITLWRDYFDKEMLFTAMAPPK